MDPQHFCIQYKKVKNPRNNYGTESTFLRGVSKSRLIPWNSVVPLIMKRDGFLRIFQEESTFYGNSYYRSEKEEGRPYSFAQVSRTRICPQSFKIVFMNTVKKS